jgi:hypothetical protein
MAINRLNVSLSGVQPGGLAKVVPTSVAVGSGSGSVDSNGAVTFSGASTVDISGCFTSAYQNYRIIYTSSGSGGDLGIRLGTGGSFNATSGNYRWNAQYAVYTSSTISGANSSTTGTYFILGNTGFVSIVDIFRPFEVANTSYIVLNSRDDYGFVSGGGAMTVTTSYDQIRFFPTGGGTISGTIRVYGYTN